MVNMAKGKYSIPTSSEGGGSGDDTLKNQGSRDEMSNFVIKDEGEGHDEDEIKKGVSQNNYPAGKRDGTRSRSSSVDSGGSSCSGSITGHSDTEHMEELEGGGFIATEVGNFDYNEIQDYHMKCEKAALRIQQRFREKKDARRMFLRRLQSQRKKQQRSKKDADDDDLYFDFDAEEEQYGEHSTGTMDMLFMETGDGRMVKNGEGEGGSESNNKNDDETSESSTSSSSEEKEPVDRAELYMAAFVAIFSCCMMWGQKVFNFLMKLMGGNDNDVGVDVADVADAVNPTNPTGIVPQGGGGGGGGGPGGGGGGKFCNNGTSENKNNNNSFSVCSAMN